jgi:hypothetical protein
MVLMGTEGRGGEDTTFSHLARIPVQNHDPLLPYPLG